MHVYPGHQGILSPSSHLIGNRHFMHSFPLGDGTALPLRRLEQLLRETNGHPAMCLPFPRSFNDPLCIQDSNIHLKLSTAPFLKVRRTFIA